MKLERIDLVNIRQFAGTQTITLATDTTRKVTLIHGPNTVGKTTLLNAIHWCLYGTFLAGFLEPERLKSDESEGDEYSIQLQFEHNGKRYVVKRSASGPPSQFKLTVLEQRPNGQSVPHPNPDLLIKTILPEALASHFFFAGEMIQKGLSSGAYQKAATDAIRSVLGLRLAEQAIDDLKDLRKKRQRDLQTISAGTDLAKVTRELADAEDFIDSRSAQLVSQRDLISQLEVQKRECFDALRDFEPTSKIQQRRDSVLKRLIQARRALTQADIARQELICDVGTAAFLADCAGQATQFIDSEITKKRIPSPFDKTFVQDILASQRCVCERPVLPGSPEYGAIANLVNSATHESVLRRALSVRGIGERIAATSERAGKAFTRALQQFQGAQEEVDRLETEEARIKELLQRHESANVRESEAALERIESTLRELVVNKQQSEDQIETAKQLINQKKTERDKATAATPAIEDAKTALEVFDALVLNLESELRLVEDHGIARIGEALNRVVGSSTRQKYSADVTREYQIKLFKSENGSARKPVVVLSSGELRLLDLCFVSALVAVCKERESEGSTILLPGAVAPLVVDAPFGDLDPEYQALAATTMMDLSEQLILMLSKTHWTKDVDDAIRPSLGAEYLMVGYRTGPALDAKPVTTEVAGKTYQQMIFDAKRNCTELLSIGRPQ